MRPLKDTLGPAETRLFAWLQFQGRPTVRTAEVARALRIPSGRASQLLDRLDEAQWVAAVRRGLYLVPSRLPLGGQWTPDEILALATLIGDRGGRYQICGPNAFQRYGFDDQVPNCVYAYNDKVSGRRRIGTVELVLIKVAAERLGDTDEVSTSDGPIAVYSSRVRTLFDAVYDWSRFNGLPRAHGWIREELDAGRVAPAELVATTLKYGDVGTRRRIGALLERLGADAVPLRKLERSLPSTSSTIAWIPTRPKRGRVDRRWGVVINDDETE